MKRELLIILFCLLTSCFKFTDTGDHDKAEVNERILIPKGKVFNEANKDYIHLDSFYIDKYEVSFMEYSKCVQQKKCPGSVLKNNYVSGTNRIPISIIGFDDAVDYCKYVGGRLPTFYEWKRAAVGDKDWKYPWGNDCNEEYANFAHEANVTTIDDYLCFNEECPRKDVSIFGVRNMAGNVGEWLDHIDGKKDSYPFIPGSLCHNEASCLPDEIYYDFGIRYPPPDSVGFRCAYDVDKMDKAVKANK